MKYVYIVFKNSIQLEGHLVSINNDEMTLLSSDKLNSIVIPSIKDNILFYKINSSKEKYDDIVDIPIKSKEDLEELVKLKGDLNSIERSSLKDKLKSPIKQVMKDNYVEQYKSIQGTLKHSEEKVAGKNPAFNTGLQSLFSKKY